MVDLPAALSGRQTYHTIWDGGALPRRGKWRVSAEGGRYTERRLSTRSRPRLAPLSRPRGRLPGGDPSGHSRPPLRSPPLRPTAVLVFNDFALRFAAKGQQTNDPTDRKPGARAPTWQGGSRCRCCGRRARRCCDSQNARRERCSPSRRHGRRGSAHYSLRWDR